MLIRTPRLPRNNLSTLSQPYDANSSSSALSFRSRVSDPSVNHPAPEPQPLPFILANARAEPELNFPQRRLGWISQFELDRLGRKCR